jgi:RNA polymerase sigma-70 factor (sigma-E family)
MGTAQGLWCDARTADVRRATGTSGATDGAATAASPATSRSTSPTPHAAFPSPSPAPAPPSPTRHARAVGDPFSDAVAGHHRELARFAYRLCGDRTLAEDIVAEAYARVWPHWRRGRIDGLLPYLMRAVANEAFTRHRRRRLERRKEPPPPPVATDPFEGQIDDHDELWAALDRLPTPQRVVLVLRIVEDLSEEQTATMLGIAPGTVKSRLSRALRTLRTIVEGNGA